MYKKISVLLGISKKDNRGRALRIAVGITAMFIVMASGAGAVTPINDCTTISSPGSYALTRNIGNSATSVFCISITSSDVVLDGAGYTIDGTDAPSTNYGVYVYNPASVLTNVNLQNLILKKWKVGINYSNAQNGILSGNNVSGNSGGGISLSSSSNNMLSGNNVSNNLNTGISLSSSNGNTLSGNIATSNSYYGIYLSSSNNNMLSGNNASLNLYTNGIYLSSSSNNTLKSNNFSNNWYGITLTSSSNNNTLSGNNVSSNSYSISLTSSSNNTLNGNYASNNAYGISLTSSGNNTLSGNNASNNAYRGIYLYSSSNNTLSGNNASNNGDGIYLFSSSNNNTLSGNIVSKNQNGIYLYISNNNTIHNNFFNNTINFAGSYTGVNIWNIAKTPGTNIVGGPYLGGNVWAYPSGTGYSQTCIDDNSDGICDSSRTLDASNIDYLPLVYRPAITPTPTLSVSANPTSVTAVTATNVVFIVTSSGSAVSGATVTLSGVATGSGTTDAIGHATISVTATGAGLITAIASKSGYTSGSTTVTASAPVITILTISASPTSVTAGTATNVVFTVTSSGSAVSGATVTLSGVATGSGTTDSLGHATISVTATGAGLITATVAKTGYTSGSTTVTANAPSATSITVVTITPTNPSAGDEINITVAINNPGASFNGTVEGNIWLPSGTGKYLGWKNMVIPTGTSTATIIGAAGGAKSSYITHENGTYYYDVFLENVDKGEYYLTATDSRLSVPFTVGPAASVYMSNIVLSASPTNGSVMTLKVTISNPTSSAFTGTMNANIWDSVRGYVLTPQSISIAAGGSSTLTFSYTPVKTGLHSYDFFMVSDVSGQNDKAPWGFPCMDYVAGIGFTVV